MSLPSLRSRGSAASVSRLSSSVRHWRGAATGGVRLRSWRDGVQFLPFAARHGLQDSYQPPACSRRPAALTGSTQRGARGASGSTKAQTPSSFDARFRSRKRLRPAMVDVAICESPRSNPRWSRRRSLHGRQKRQVVRVPPRPPPLEVGARLAAAAIGPARPPAIRLRVWFGRRRVTANRARKPVKQPAMRSRNQQQSRHRRSGAGAQQNGDLIRQWRHRPPIYAGFSDGFQAQATVLRQPPVSKWSGIVLHSAKQPSVPVRKMLRRCRHHLQQSRSISRLG